MRSTIRPGVTSFGNQWGQRSLLYGFHDDRAGLAWCIMNMQVLRGRTLTGIAIFEAIVSEGMYGVV